MFHGFRQDLLYGFGFRLEANLSTAPAALKMTLTLIRGKSDWKIMIVTHFQGSFNKLTCSHLLLNDADKASASGGSIIAPLTLSFTLGLNRPRLGE